MSSKTAWSRSSSVPSDRIPPSRTPTPNRNKRKGKDNEHPKSKEVLRLEALVAGLKAGIGGNDPKGACYCQARNHPLSKYTPNCLRCGFILCSLHAPFYPCPHCSSPLMSPSARETLIQSLVDEISAVIAREAEEREREQQELQKAAGAFPTLNAFTGGVKSPAVAQPHKVLTLNSSTRKVTVSSYVQAPSIRSSPKAEAKEEEKIRVPPPPKEVDYVRSKPAEGGRWQNLRDEGWAYVPLPAQGNAQGSATARRKKKKAKENNAT